MRLENLKYLMEVAKTGSITKAADRLFMSKSALSAAIKNLEDELDIPLLKRTFYGVELTAAGEMVLNKAKLIFDLMDQMEAEAWLYREKESLQQMNVYLAGNAAGDIFALLLKDLKRIAGNARITAITCTKETMIESIRQDENNMGLLFITFDNAMGAFNAPDVVLSEINRSKIYAIAAKYSKHIPDDKTMLSEKDLSQVPIISYSGQNVEGSHSEEEGVVSVFATDDIDIYMQAILEDIGIGFLTWNLILKDPLFEQKIRVIPVEEARYNVLYLLTNKNFNCELRAKIENSLFKIIGKYNM